MTSVSRSRRWAVPAGVAAAVLTITVTASVSAHADDHPPLPPRSAAELLAAVASATPHDVAGTVRETINLGLPDLSSLAGAGHGAGQTLSLQTLITGTHDFRVWASGPDRQRIALLGDLAETDMIHNGTDLWTYSSDAHAANHTTLPPMPAREKASVVAPDAPTPQAVAAAALAAIDPTTAVTVDTTARVADRPAYRLVLTPRDARTLVGSVRIAIDAETNVPLQAQVFARGSATAAIDVGFTQVDFGAVDPSVFVFTPPVGATVSDGKGILPSAGGDRGDRPAPPAPTDSGPADPAVLGAGWTAVATVRLPALSGGDTAQLLDAVSKPVDGGRVITTSLVTVLLANDGHVYIGAVSAADLQTVAASGHGL